MRVALPTLLWLCCGLAGNLLQAGDWPHWRGPQRNDVVDEDSGYRDGHWRLSDRPAWQVETGEGSSSPLVWKNQVFTFGWKDNREVVAGWEAASGKSLWRSSYPAPRYGRFATGDENFYSGPSSTPELDPATGWLYTLGIDGDLQAWDTALPDRPVWQRNLYENYKVPQRPRVNRSGLRDYGYTSSPLIYRDWVIVEVGAPEGTLIAFDKRSGEERWKSQVHGPAGHNGGPVLMEVESVPCVAVHHFDGLLVARLDDGHAGETVATVPWRTEFGNNVAAPAVFENNVLLTSSYNHHRLARFRIGLQTGAEQVWSLDEASKVCSPVIRNGHIYWAWQRMHCVDFETGKVCWQGGSFGDPGSLIATRDGRLIAWSQQGELSLIEGFEHAPDKYVELARRRGLADSEAWPHVVLAQGRLFLKDRNGHLACYEMQP